MLLLYFILFSMNCVVDGAINKSLHTLKVQHKSKVGVYYPNVKPDREMQDT